jgi:hypothetical protein
MSNLDLVTLDSIVQHQRYNHNSDFNVIAIDKGSLPTVVALVAEGKRLYHTPDTLMAVTTDKYTYVNCRIKPWYWSNDPSSRKADYTCASHFNWFKWWYLKWKVYQLLKSREPALAKRWYNNYQHKPMYHTVDHFTMNMPVPHVRLYEIISAIVYFVVIAECNDHCPKETDNPLFWATLDKFFEHYPDLVGIERM